MTHAEKKTLFVVTEIKVSSSGEKSKRESIFNARVGHFKVFRNVRLKFDEDPLENDVSSGF